jgi:hypothetical protein
MVVRIRNRNVTTEELFGELAEPPAEMTELGAAEVRAGGPNETLAQKAALIEC